jgi:hypothetical protein
MVHYPGGLFPRGPGILGCDGTLRALGSLLIRKDGLTVKTIFALLLVALMAVTMITTTSGCKSDTKTSTGGGGAGTESKKG